MSVLLHFNSRFFEGGFFLGLVSDFKQKVLSPSGYRALPPSVHMTWRECGSCPLRSLQSGGADNSQSES